METHDDDPNALSDLPALGGAAARRSRIGRPLLERHRSARFPVRRSAMRHVQLALTALVAILGASTLLVANDQAPTTSVEIDTYDCNGNTIADSREIGADPNLDFNLNWVIDQC